MSRYAIGQRGAPDDSLTQQSPRSCRSRSFWERGRGRIPRQAHSVMPRDHNAAFRGTCSRFCHGMCICGRASGHHTAIRGASAKQCAPVVATSVTRPQDLARTRPYAKKCVPVTPPRSLSCAKGSDPCDTMRQKRPGRFCLIDVAANPSTIGWLVEASIRCASRLLAATVWLSTPPLEPEE